MGNLPEGLRQIEAAFLALHARAPGIRADWSCDGDGRERWQITAPAWLRGKQAALIRETFTQAATQAAATVAEAKGRRPGHDALADWLSFVRQAVPCFEVSPDTLRISPAPPPPDERDPAVLRKYIDNVENRGVVTMQFGWIESAAEVSALAVRRLAETAVTAPAAADCVEGAPTIESSQDSPWVPAVTLWRDKFKTNKELSKFRRSHPDLFRNPSRNRLEIHAAKWTAYWANFDRKGFEALDGDRPSIADDPTIQDEALLGAMQRIAAMREKKKGRK